MAIYGHSTQSAFRLVEWTVNTADTLTDDEQWAVACDLTDLAADEFANDASAAWTELLRRIGGPTNLKAYAATQVTRFSYSGRLGANAPGRQ
jgi:hypothetical protein